jgi:hypothetical protein
MFSEPQAQAKACAALWLEKLARRHPQGFDVMLILLAVAVTVLLLRQTGYSLVLYQGF